jgi:hypothetical protein
MFGATGLPHWAIAAAVAVFAPFAARALAVQFERRARERSRRAFGASKSNGLGVRPTKSDEGDVR